MKFKNMAWLDKETLPKYRRYPKRNFKQLQKSRRKFHKHIVVNRSKLYAWSVENQKKNIPAEMRFKEIMDSLDIKYLYQPICKKKNFIPDFVLEYPYFIVFEIDGSYHQTEDKKLDDFFRDKYFGLQGYKVVRFANSQIFKDFNAVKQKVGEVVKFQKQLNRNVVFKGNLFFQPSGGMIKQAKTPQDSGHLAVTGNN
jgi:very-short-patch-repair endonuclease